METHGRSIGQPTTYREVMYGELGKREKLLLETDLAQVELTPNQLVEMLARTLAEKERPGSDSDIDAALDPIAVSRICRDKRTLAKIIRSELGPLRRQKIEDDAKAVLLGEDGLSDTEARAAISAIDPHERRDIAGSFTRNIEQCARHLANLARAHHDRQHESPDPAPQIMSEEEARLRGPATSDMFYRAVEPATGDAEIAAIVGPVLAGLRDLDRELRQPDPLGQQLASRKMLRAGQERHLKAEVSVRRHFPFGLVRPGSLAILAAGVYLVRAQASDSIIRAAQSQSSGIQDTAKLFITTFNDLSSAVHRKIKSDRARGWDTYYSPTPGALDCLRAAAHVMSSDKIPAFLRVPPPSKSSSTPDHAHRLLNTAFPLEEQGEAPWSNSRWNPFGQQLLHKINKEQHKQAKHLLFHDEEFELVAGKLAGLVLTELIHRLQRAEGLASGLPNTRKTYQHSSILSLNKFLTTAVTNPFNKAFEKYRVSLTNRNFYIRDAAKNLKKPDAGSAVHLPSDLPHGIVLLTMESVRQTMERLLSSLEEHDWAYTQFDNPSAFPAESLRLTAGEMLELSYWAEINQTLLINMSLDEILRTYHTLNVKSSAARYQTRKTQLSYAL